MQPRPIRKSGSDAAAGIIDAEASSRTRSHGHHYCDEQPCQHYLGQLDRAADIQQQVLLRQQQIFGDDHLNTIQAMSDLAATLLTQGQH